MSRSLFQVNIPEPCHEDWDRMQPDEKGKFCHACCQPVYDFSEKTPEEIRDTLLLQSSGKICGYFRETQLDKPLAIMPSPGLSSFTRHFALAIYLVFGSLLFSCKTVQESDSKVHVDWKQDGPVFQKGRFTVSGPDLDSARRVYGKADLINYLPEETSDSLHVN